MSQLAEQGIARCGGRGAAVRKWVGLIGLTLAVAACGGGGGGGDGTTGGSNGGSTYTPGDGSGTALLTWVAPTAREDGRSITVSDINGYRIHFGPAADPEQWVIEVNGGSQSQYSVTGLDPDTYYFAVSAVDTGGQESGLSNSMTKVIAN